MAEQTIAEALNLSEEWAVVNRLRVEKSSERNNSVSDTMLECIENIRNEEMGETSAPITNYERKIAMMGFHLAQEMMSNKMHAIQSIPMGIGSIGSLLQALKKFRDEAEEDEG
jgi:hypothetical protein